MTPTPLSKLPSRSERRLSAIAIVASNGVIGDGEAQPFCFAEDWAHFKRLTVGHPMIVGRKTHDAMGMLSNRMSIVVTRDPSSMRFPENPPTGASGIAVSSMEEALTRAFEEDDHVFLVGGGQIYRLGWDQVTDLEITEVHADAEGAVTFPKIDPDKWREVSRDRRGEFDFVRYERID